jgi:hypothetical protein
MNFHNDYNVELLALVAIYPWKEGDQDLAETIAVVPLNVNFGFLTDRDCEQNFQVERSPPNAGRRVAVCH